MTNTPEQWHEHAGLETNWYALYQEAAADRDAILEAFGTDNSEDVIAAADRLEAVRQSASSRHQEVADAIADAYNNEHQDPAGRAADAAISILTAGTASQEGRDE